MDRVDLLAEIEAIKQLKARYFRTLDTKDWDGFRDVFTVDFVSDTRPSGGKRIEGRDDFLAFLAKAIGERGTLHQGHMPEIEVQSAMSATGVWAMEDWVRFFPGVSLHGYGHYHETYRKEDGGWRISSSTLTRVRQDICLPFWTFHVSPRLQRRMQRLATRDS